ncbi:hypothetical protein, partial [Micromonospora sp. NPDC049679]|uniref:hypothetical protein n=1 Tax=Micromonospora sp. NPDC049679 TaxID=3155920 RepID=UPI0033F0E4CB
MITRSAPAATARIAGPVTSTSPAESGRATRTRRGRPTRAPLWQQRQRAAQLLDVAREYADFPI